MAGVESEIYENNVELPKYSEKPQYASLRPNNQESENPVMPPHQTSHHPTAMKDPKAKILKIALIVVVVLLLVGAFVMAALAFAKYKELDDLVRKTSDSGENNNNNNNNDNNNNNNNPGDNVYETCADDPCKHNGKCVNIIQGGYYCICNSEKYYGRHCENALGDERPILFPHTCKNIRQNDPEAPSGVYMIQILDTDRVFPVYCDQDTDGGGWTLVWRYGFTNYEFFADVSNAVTPIPYWNVVSSIHLRSDVEASTTPPLSESEKGAVDFALWKSIGSEFMVKSNINNWIKCWPSQSGGSLVEMKSGAIQCELVKAVHNCTSSSPRLPINIQVVNNYAGPLLCTYTTNNAAYYYYNWVSTTTSSYPVHDPCGRSGANQKQNVQDPFGAIFLR